MSKISFPDFWKYYDQDNVNHKEAICLLEASMPQSLLTDEAAWVVKYREPEPKPEAGSSANPLEVEHDSQYNNPSQEGWRECFSSSCAMAVHYWLPEVKFNDYHARRPKYGDSTDASAQVRTIQSFGLEAKFVQLGSVEKLKEQIDLGRPTVCGYLHKGTGHGSGGGHYLTVIGYDETGFWVNDPGGSCDLVNGGFVDTSQYAGRMQHYSYKNWVPRWSVANDHDGWAVGIKPPGK